MNNTENEVRPWYKEPYVWMIIAIPASAVVYGMFFLTVSITSYDGMVVDDYYKKGKEINRVLKRDKAALGHGLRAQVEVDKNTLTIFLASNNTYTPPPTLEVGFFYATKAGLDKATFVEIQQPGIYQGELASLETGRWNVQIEADDWRLIGSLQAPDEAQVVIEPAVKK
ncbi:MAG TPA: hypothetical protein DDW55_11615 [Gammaproteobacteria bacterium]|nr:hypothetical protein [Gammaproteobacteria bacterium]